ncbi:hypothetical protein LSUB1_G002409 [Lachnellula subtilissima]|uniref:BTB domain-containing protein n=1 Tax=Lachnellula subtilissima TaxID=602034 RepID=A0A8H8UB35_9HELO|nr:hypothetical protein LSUB1_G002409 [Lachnellula subtilissima]
MAQPEILGDNLGTELVTIYVGKEQKEYIVHKKAICDTADYFSKAFTGAFEERVGVMYLPEESSDAFGLFVHWLYRGRVSLVHSQKHLERLFKLYVFAEKLCLVELANKTMDIIRIISLYNPEAETKNSMVSYAFRNTFTDSPIRKWALQDYVRHLYKSNLSGIPIEKDSDSFRLLCRENEDFFQGYLRLVRGNSFREIPNPGFNDSGCNFHRHQANGACYMDETNEDEHLDWIPSSESFYDETIS